MLRQTFTPLANANRALLRRSFCISAPRLGEGDAGSPRSGAGGTSGDSFTKREAAQEAMYIREKELEKLAKLRKQINEHRGHLDELENHINKLTQEQQKR